MCLSKIMEDKHIKQIKHNYNPVSTLNDERQRVAQLSPQSQQTIPFQLATQSKKRNSLGGKSTLDFRNSPAIILSEAPSLVNTLSIGVSLQTSAGT